MPQGLNQLRKNLPVHLSDMNNDLTHIARFVLSDLYEQLIKIDENIAKVTTQLIEFAKQILPANYSLHYLELVGL